MHSVFLSYSRQELTFADSVFQELVQRDIPIWMDIYRLKPGEAWQEQIFTALDTADTLLFIVSRASIESENCIAELKHARRTKKRVIYLVFESVDYILQDTNAPVVDFRRPFNDAMRDLNELLTTERVPHTGLIASLKEKKLPPTPARFVMASVAQSLLLFVPVMLLIVEYLAVNTQSMVVMLGSLALGVGLLVFFSFAALRGWTIPGAKQAKWLLILNPLMFFMAGLFLTPSAMRDRTYRYWRTVLSVFFWMLSVFFWLPITVFFMLLTAGGLDIESTMFDSLGHGVMIIAGVMLLVNVALFVYLFYLMGTPGMYRWAGPYGIPFTRYAGPVRFLRWPGLLMIVCGIGAAVLIIRGVTHPDMAAGDLLPVRLVWFGLLLVFVTLVIGVITGVVYYVSRSARRYRRIARIGERGQSTAAGVDYAEADRKHGQALEKLLSRHHQIVDPDDAEIVVSLLSAAKPTVYSGSQRVVPVLVGGEYEQLGDDVTHLQIIDWRANVNRDLQEQFAIALTDPDELTVVMNNFPRRLDRSLPAREARTRLTVSIRLAAIASLVLVMGVYLWAQEVGYNSPFLIAFFDDFVSPMVFTFACGAGIFVPRGLNARRYMGFMIALAVVAYVLRGLAIYLAIVGVWVFPVMYSYLDRGVARILVGVRQ